MAHLRQPCDCRLPPLLLLVALHRRVRSHAASSKQTFMFIAPTAKVAPPRCAADMASTTQAVHNLCTLQLLKSFPLLPAKVYRPDLLFL